MLICLSVRVCVGGCVHACMCVCVWEGVGKMNDPGVKEAAVRSKRGKNVCFCSSILFSSKRKEKEGRLTKINTSQI